MTATAASAGRTTPRIVCSFVLATILFGVTSVRADKQSDRRKAEAHFVAANALYEAGSYEEALREFLAGYEVSPLPDFLLNAGQCYRKLGQLDKAVDMFNDYLASAATDDPWRPKVHKLIAEIRAKRDEELVRGASPPPTAPVPAPPQSTAAPPAMASSSASAGRTAMILSATPPPKTARRGPIVRRKWFWGVLAGGAVVVGGAIALGVALGAPTKTYPTPALGSVPVE